MQRPTHHHFHKKSNNIGLKSWYVYFGSNKMSTGYILGNHTNEFIAKERLWKMTLPSMVIKYINKAK